MRTALSYVFALLLLSSFSAFAGTVDVTVSSLGGTEYLFSYDLQGFTFQANQELDFEFDSSLFDRPVTHDPLSNAMVGSDFTANVIQPVPSGPPGLFEITPLVGNPSLAGTFSIDANYIGSGTPSGIQPFTVYEFDENWNASVIERGTTVAATPEPGNVSLVLVGLIAVLYGSRARIMKMAR